MYLSVKALQISLTVLGFAVLTALLLPPLAIYVVVGIDMVWDGLWQGVVVLGIVLAVVAVVVLIAGLVVRRLLKAG